MRFDRHSEFEECGLVACLTIVLVHVVATELLLSYFRSHHLSVIAVVHCFVDTVISTILYF